MAFFMKCDLCGELFDPKGEQPKQLTVANDDTEKDVLCCEACFEKYRDGRDNFYHLLDRK